MVQDQSIQDAHAALLAKGKETLDSMTYSGWAEARLAVKSAFQRPAYEYLFENCFGIWARDGLDRKYRSLVTISILASTGKLEQVKAHVKMGLDNGLTEEEIREALFHVLGYCGFPAGLDAFAAADEVLQAYQKE